MALDIDQRLKLDMILNGSEASPEALSEWETGFVSSIAKRHEQYGDDIAISIKQWAILDRIYVSVMVAEEAKVASGSC